MSVGEAGPEQLENEMDRIVGRAAHDRPAPLGGERRPVGADNQGSI